MRPPPGENKAFRIYTHVVIASEAKQSILSSRRDGFASLAMTVWLFEK
jgi:hypothetical protein